MVGQGESHKAHRAHLAHGKFTEVGNVLLCSTDLIYIGVSLVCFILGQPVRNKEKAKIEVSVILQ